MKPVNRAWRPGRWLIAAAMALSLAPAPAFAEDTLTPVKEEKAQLKPPVTKVAEPMLEALKDLKLRRPGDEGPRVERDGSDVSVFLHKTGAQIDCDYVVYKIRYGIKANAAILSAPEFAALLKTVKMDFKDQIPAGLSIVGTTIVGDITDSTGLNPATSSISTAVTTNDTLSIADFRLSASDLNGDGSPDQRYVDIKITAKIDRAAFPAVTAVLNQAVVTISEEGGFSKDILSHDPALPDDGDYWTGDATKITIDVTRCEPPGGGDTPEEACFKVDTGTVDCDEAGGGAFIYSMTFGAEMGGRVIELTTTTPGINIAPPAQVVPAGGGVLNWTITGAMPGDVVHIVVVGTETFAGPEEGWGICCTQTIDIVIPEDLDCPEKQPDIKVEKKAEVEHCTEAGGCKFTIRVSNVGDAPYNGPIVLDEVTLPGNATIDGGPNAPWVCAPMTSPMLCTHPATTLNPGEFVDLKLSFKPGPGWPARFIRNCAKYNYTESGKPLFGSQLNDRACAEIPLCDPKGTTIHDRECQPPTERKADLQLRKIAREFCSPDGLCLYGILVTNVGTVTHNGPLTVADEFPGGTPTSVTFAPTPPWVCATLTPSTFRCDHPGIILVPGASTPILVRAIVPLDYPDGKVENCAKLSPVPTETNLANNQACATAKLRQPQGQPALRITKVCKPGVAGGAVSCRITVNSVGTSAPVGPVRVNDAATIIGSGAPINIQTVTPDGAEWSCSAVPAANLSCQIPGAIMTPGTSRHFDVTVAMPAGGNARFENCARGSYGPAPGGDVVYPFGEACDQGGTDIVVKKTGDAQCEVGQPCSFTVTITNNGDSDFSGPVQVGDAIEIEGIGRLEGVEIQSIEPPFGCAPEPTALPFGCTANVTIPAGASQPHVVTVVIPDSDALAKVTPNGVAGRNCVGVTGDRVTIGTLGHSAPGQIDRSENGAFSCHPFRLVKTEPEKQCSEGFVMNANGRCVCPEGTTFSQGRGRCVGDPVKPVEPEQPDEPQATPQCKLLPGMIRTQNGNCVCPRGTQLKQGRCVKPEVVQQCKLLPGMIRTKNGNCICPRGTVLGKRGCVKVEVPVRECKLLPGQIRTKEGKCICPRGTVLGRKGCVKIEQPTVQCRLPGQVKDKNGRCVCPRGTILLRGQCMQPIDNTPTIRRCPAGTIGVFPVCVKPGQIERRCPKGTVGQYPNCVRRQIQQPVPGLNLQGNDPLKNPG